MNIESLKLLSMDGKTAVITGSTQGLGETIAHMFADRGVSQMVITGRNAERGQAVKAALEAKKVKTVFVSAELGKMEDVRKVMAACESSFGRIDALVNAAALTDRGTIWDTSEQRYDELFDVNVAYSVMKYRIRVNGLNIGWMDTPGEDRIMKTYHDADPDWLKKAEAGRPFGRLLKPTEVARATAYLSSEESGLMTGSIIDFDQQVLGAGNSSAEPPPANW